MNKIAFFNSKSYDIESFNEIVLSYNYDITYFGFRLTEKTAAYTKGFDAVCCFVNDDLNKNVCEILYKNGIQVILLRCAGFNQVDLEACKNKITVLRVPSYSPSSVAEHAAALLLACNRKIHKAYLKTKNNNFDIDGLIGKNLENLTAGVIGTGKIGKVMIKILEGFGMNIIAYDTFQDTNSKINYVTLEELYSNSDIITLHCPLTPDTKYMINEESILKMKDGIILINSSRGALIDTTALINALKKNKFHAVGLDVYENESELFFADRSNEVVDDDNLNILRGFNNVIMTSHQAFLTDRALKAIAQTTLDNMDDYINGQDLKNIVL